MKPRQEILLGKTKMESITGLKVVQTVILNSGTVRELC